MPHRTIRLLPNLSVAALKANLGKELPMWYCLRAVNHWGIGCLDLEYAVKALTDTFGYSRSTAYRILNAGDGIFWDKRLLKNFNRLQIQIHGLQKVAKHFDIRCGMYFLEIPVEEFVDHSETNVKSLYSGSYWGQHTITATVRQNRVYSCSKLC